MVCDFDSLIDNVPPVHDLIAFLMYAARGCPCLGEPINIYQPLDWATLCNFSSNSLKSNERAWYSFSWVLTIKRENAHTTINVSIFNSLLSLYLYTQKSE